MSYGPPRQSKESDEPPSPARLIKAAMLGLLVLAIIIGTFVAVGEGAIWYVYKYVLAK